jgi:phage-related protein
MRQAGRLAVADFIRTFTDPLVAALRNSRAFTALSRRLRMLRTDFQIVGNYVRGQFGDAMTGLRTGIQNTIQPFREFRQEVGERSRQAVDELREGMTHLKISTQDLRDTFPGLARAFDNARERVRPLTDAFTTLRDRFSKIRESVADNRTGLLDLRTALADLEYTTLRQNEAFDKATGVQGSFQKAIRKSTDESSSFFGTWKRLPHGFRQFTVWTAAILSAFEQLAVLGSAAGGSLLIFGGALTQIGIGVGATIAVFQDLTEEVSTLPGWLQPAATAFQDIGKAFSELQDSIQQTALTNAVAAFESMAATVRALTPAFEPLARVIGEAIGNLAENLAPGTRAFENLERLVRNSAPTFETFLDIAGKFGDALVEAFTDPAMQRAIGKFLGWIEEIADQFLEFTQSDDFGKWIDQTVDVMGSFTGLLEGLSATLSNLVTPAAAERTKAFLDSLTGALPGIESMLAAFGELDVFGLFAEALETIMSVLRPFFEVIAPIAAIIRDVLVVAFQNLANVMGFLEVLLLPARLLWEGLATVFQAVIDWLAPLQGAFGEVTEALQGATDKIVEALVPAFGDIIDAVVAMLPSPQEFANFLTNTLVPAIQSAADWIITYLVPALQDFAAWIRDTAVPAAQEFWRFINNNLIPVFAALAPALEAGWKAFQSFGRFVGDVMRGLVAPIQTAVSWINSLIAGINTLNGKSLSVGAGGGGGGRGLQSMATGGLLTGPTRVLAGEAGPEAIVPLRRSLSQVDPSVRWLSAIAQGKDPNMASGGVVGGGKSISVGEVNVYEAGDPRRSANDVIQRLVEYAVG